MIKSTMKYFFPEAYKSREWAYRLIGNEFTLSVQVDDLTLDGKINDMAILIDDRKIGWIELENGTLTYHFEEGTPQTTKNDAISLYLTDIILNDRVPFPTDLRRHHQISNAVDTICVDNPDNETAELLASLDFTQEGDSKHTVDLGKLKVKADKLKELRCMSYPAKVFLTYLVTIFGILSAAEGLSTLSNARQTKNIIEGSLKLLIGLACVYFAFTSPWDRARKDPRSTQNFLHEAARAGRQIMPETETAAPTISVQNSLNVSTSAAGKTRTVTHTTAPRSGRH